MHRSPFRDFPHFFSRTFIFCLFVFEIFHSCKLSYCTSYLLLKKFLHLSESDVDVGWLKKNWMFEFQIGSNWYKIKTFWFCLFKIVIFKTERLFCHCLFENFLYFLLLLLLYTLGYTFRSLLNLQCSLYTLQIQDGSKRRRKTLMHGKSIKWLHSE